MVKVGCTYTCTHVFYTRVDALEYASSYIHIYASLHMYAYLHIRKVQMTEMMILIEEQEERMAWLQAPCVTLLRKHLYL